MSCKGVFPINEAIVNADIRRELIKKHRGRRVIRSKKIMTYPMQLEREYRRIAKAYMVLLNKALAKHLPALRRAMANERRLLRMDASRDVTKAIEETFFAIRSELKLTYYGFRLPSRLLKLAGRASVWKTKEWARVIRATIGLQIDKDYYSGEFFRNAIDLWTNVNTSLITSIPDQALDTMRQIVTEGFFTGRTNEDITEQIQEVYRTSKAKAEFIARDQVSKLNSEMTQQQHSDAGVEEYIWSSSQDERVRDCHRELDGKKFRWSEPPEQWYETKSQGRVYTGYRAHPGASFCCRCVALPVINLEGITLPWLREEDSTNGETE